MSSQAGQLEIVGPMAAHESAIADLQRAYAQQIPDHRSFSEELGDDKVRHARMMLAVMPYLSNSLAAGRHTNP